MKKIALPILLASSLGLFGVACSEADQIYDCTQICEKYEDCVQDELDNTACVDSCEEEAEVDEDFEESVDECESCLDSTSCTEATASCTDECAFIIAESVD